MTTEIKEILKEKEIEDTVVAMFSSVLEHLEISSEKIQEIIEKCLDFAKNYSNINEYEKEANQILNVNGVVDKIPAKLSNRAEIIYNEIKPYLVEGNVLDYGCGDGKVGELLNEDHEIILTDIYEHSHIKDTGLSFKIFKQGENAPFSEEEFDNVLALTVFHHSSDPLKSLKDIFRVIKLSGRLIVIESVYGVNGEELSESERDKIKEFLSLTEEQQRRVNVFFDHFYNRIIHFTEDIENKVNVPFNFNTPEGWKEVFEKEGFEQEKVIHYGLDQPTVPEYHTLHILRKVKK